MPIRHLILSGGAYNGLVFLGALQALSEATFYDLGRIQSVFGTSIGSLVGTIAILGLDWSDITAYFINRPWDRLIQLTPEMVVDVLSRKGLFDNTHIKTLLEPLLRQKGLGLEITLEQFQKFSKIELHIFAIKVEGLEVVDFTAKTHPTVRLVDAIYMSCSMPFIFQPLFLDGSYYVDGGLIDIFPMAACLESGASCRGNTRPTYRHGSRA